MTAGDAPPIDEDHARKVRLLRTVLRTMLVLATFGAVSSLLEPANPLWVTGLFYGLVFVALYGLHRALRRGAVVLGVWAVGLFLWVLVAFVTLFFGGMQGQNAAVFGVISMLIGSVAGGRAAVFTAIASSVWCAGIVALELTHTLPTSPGPPYSPVNAWGAFTVTLVMITMMMRDSLESMRAMHAQTVAAAAERDAALRRSIQGQKMELVGNLASSVAHDFNNLLTVITGASEVLREQLAGRAAESLGLVDEIDEAAARAGLMTRQLLTFGRAKPSQLDIIDLADQVRVFAQLLPRLLGPGITLEVELATGALVVASPVGLEQILLNLAVNARDAMPKGGRLEIKVSSDATDVYLSVADTGGGMDAATQARIFTPFFTTKPTGTGLGLATVHEQVTRLHGSIKVESEPARGTCLTIRIPRAPAHESATAARPVAGARAPAGERDALEVLLVDDDPGVRRALARTLTRAGFIVVEASDGMEALALLPAHPRLHCVVTDIMMPNLDGRALAARIASLAPTLPVILISGNDALDEIAEPRRLALAKPVPADVLLSAIARLTR